MKADFLTPKQQLFCDEYLTDFNAHRAALRAGYSAATALNGQLMQLPKVKLYIQQRSTETAQKAQVGREEVLAELCKIAFGSFGNYYAPDGNLKPMADLTDDEKAALWQAKTNSDGTTTVKMYNKLVALEKIAKILNLYTHQVTQPEKEIVYVDREDTTEDDYFEDTELKEKHNVFIDEHGRPLYENGLLPYGPISEIFGFSTTENGEELLGRLKHYEVMQAKMKSMNGCRFETADFRGQFNDWLDAQLRQHGCVIAGNEFDDIVEKYEALIAFMRKVDVKMAG